MWPTSQRLSDSVVSQRWITFTTPVDTFENVDASKIAADLTGDMRKLTIPRRHEARPRPDRGAYGPKSVNGE